MLFCSLNCWVPAINFGCDLGITCAHLNFRYLVSTGEEGDEEGTHGISSYFGVCQSPWKQLLRGASVLYLKYNMWTLKQAEKASAFQTEARGRIDIHQSKKNLPTNSKAFHQISTYYDSKPLLGAVCRWELGVYHRLHSCRLLSFSYQSVSWGLSGNYNWHHASQELKDKQFLQVKSSNYPNFHKKGDVGTGGLPGLH